LEDVKSGGVHGTEGGERIESQADTGGGELFGSEEGRFSKFGDVGEDGDFDGVGELAVLVKVGESFGEDHVCASVAIGEGAGDTGLHALAGDGVGAGHEDEGGIGFAADGGFDAADHFFGADEFLAGEVAAAFGFDLVFDVNSAGTRSDHFADGFSWVAPGGIGIYEQWQARNAGDAANINEDVFESGEANVWDSIGGVGDACAGEVESFEAGVFSENGSVGIDDADDLQRAFGFESGSKASAGRG